MGDDRTAAARSGRGRARPSPAQRRLSVLLLALALQGAAAAAPARIASLNLCADSMLLELVDDARIASVTALSRDPALSPHHARAAALPVNHGAVEEVLTGKPDLVLSGPSTSRQAEQLLARLAVPVHRIEHPDTFAAYRAALLALGELLGVPARAHRLAATLDRELAAGGDPGPRLRALVYQPNGFAPGRGTLVDTVLARAGLANVATELGLGYGGFVALETLLVAAPDVLVLSGRPGTTPSLADELLRHPALRRAGRDMRRITIGEQLWTCAGLHTLEAVRQLRALAP